MALYRVRDRQVRAKVLDEVGKKLQRIAAAAARNLNDQQKHRKSFAQVGEGNHQRVDDEGENEPRHPEANEIQKRIRDLNPQEQHVSQCQNRALKQGEQRDRPESAEKQLRSRRVVELLDVRAPGHHFKRDHHQKRAIQSASVVYKGDIAEPKFIHGIDRVAVELTGADKADASAVGDQIR